MWIPGKSDSSYGMRTGLSTREEYPMHLRFCFSLQNGILALNLLGVITFYPETLLTGHVGVPALKELTTWLRRWTSECLGRKWYDRVSAREHGKGKGVWASQGEGTCDKYTREAAEGGSSKREVAGGRPLEVEKTFTSVQKHRGVYQCPENSKYFSTARASLKCKREKL